VPIGIVLAVSDQTSFYIPESVEISANSEREQLFLFSENQLAVIFHNVMWKMNGGPRRIPQFTQAFCL